MVEYNFINIISATMPIKKSAEKALRQSGVRAARNRSAKENISYLLKQCKKAVESKDTEKAKDFLARAIKAIDKATQKKMLKKNSAARKKSGIAKKVNAILKK